MSDLATKQYVIDMIGRYVGQFSGGGGTVPDDPAGIIKTCKDYTDEQITNANTYAETVAGNARADAEAASNAYAAAQAEAAMNTAEGAAKDYTDAEIDAANDYAEQQAETAMNTAEGAAKDYTDEQIILAKQYADGVAATTRTEAETAAKNYTDAEIAKCNSYAEQQATQARTDATAAAKNYTDDEIAAANDYAEAQAAAAMNEANNTILSYVRGRLTELDYEFRDVAITNAWQGIYYVDVARPAALANKHIVSTMIVQTYGGAPMGVYPTAPGDTSAIRFISPVSKTMHVTVRFLILTKDEDETT